VAEGSRPAFPNYLERPRWLPIAAWHVLRVLGLAAVSGLLWLCFARPALALALFWGLAVPVLPLVFLALPGLWRNLCPLAATNQLPRLFGLTRGLTLPTSVRRYAVLIGLGALFLAVSSRRILFDNDATALAALIGGALFLALLGGLVFKGKSGWCGSFCPLLPVQRLYGQEPLRVISNSHCQPCVGCTRNCYDFNPRVAWLADLYDDDSGLGTDRRLVAGAVPGLVLAYFTAPADPGFVAQLLHHGLYVLVGIGAYWSAEALFRQSAQRTTVVFGAIALNLYYWFASVTLFATIARLSGAALPVDALAWALRVLVFALSLHWIVRSVAKEPLFLAQSFAQGPRAQVATKALALHHAADSPVVTLEPGAKQLVASTGGTLLDLLEANDCSINAGCRMGACGADPVAVLSGAENLSPCNDRERDTLRRLGYGEGVRLACSARVQGPVGVHLDPGMAAPAADAEALAVDDGLERIVIVGNGIAGVTAADVIRRHWKTGELHLVGAERHPLYNRMAITKLIYGRTAMQGLLLMPEKWYEERSILTWLNTRVRRIDAAGRKVELATGEFLPYDRLILTAGSRSFVPPIEGFARPGCFTLREADDAMAIRDYVQQHDARQAVVAGGGLLGLEAAYGLMRLGLRVCVLDRSNQLLSRQLDARASQHLRTYLEGLGLELGFGQEVAAAEGEPRLRQLRLKNGDMIDADLLLVAAGIAPNLLLAGEAGAQTGRGIQVDDRMRSSIEHVYAAGDAAEWRGAPGQVPGLWTVAVEQGRIAALNALGGEAVYAPKPVPVALKVAGVDLTSIGQFEPADGDEAFVFEDGSRYRKLVLREGRAVGALLLGHPELADAVVGAVDAGRDVGNQRAALASGDWSGLKAGV
jgi:nitrite reductase (NADH) large subunit